MSDTIEQLSILAPLVPGCFYWKDKEGIYRGCNEAFLKALGIKSTDIIGKTDEQLWIKQAKDIKIHDQTVIHNNQLITRKEVILSKQGQPKEFLVVKMPWKDEKNNILGVLANLIEMPTNRQDELSLEATKVSNSMDRSNISVIHNTELISRKSRILLVEDQQFAAEITKIILSELNCQVDLAFNAKTAIQLAKNNVYDLIFMDIGLSDLDGYEATRRIRLNESHQDHHIPIIALTAHVDQKERERCIGSGMNAILIKPLLKEKALDMLNAFIPKAQEIKIPVAANDDMDWSVLTGKTIDIYKGAELFNGNIALAKKMVDSFIASLPAELKELEHAYKSEDWTIIEKVVHQLRGNVSYCGMPRLQEACARLENHLKAGYRELASLLYKQLLKEIDAVKKEHLLSAE